MKKKSLFLVALLSVTVLSGCELGDKLSSKYGKPEADDGKIVMGTPEVKPDATFALEELNLSGIKGTATLTQKTGGVEVVLTLAGTTEDSKHPAHVHTGTCVDLGGVKYSLNPVVGGTSTTLVAATVEELKAQSFAINIHKSDTELASYIACGDVSFKAAQEVSDEEAEDAAEETAEEAKEEGKEDTETPTEGVIPAGEGTLESDKNPPAKAEEEKKPAIPKAPETTNSSEPVSIENMENVQVFNIKASQFSFMPGDIKVKEGTVVTLNVASLDVDHGLSLPEYGVNLMIPAGETKTTTFTANKKGVFTFKCSTYCGSGHGDMKGTLTVE